MNVTHLVRAAAATACFFSASSVFAQTALFGQGTSAAGARNNLQSLLGTTGTNNLDAVSLGPLPASIPLGVFQVSVASGSGSSGTIVDAVNTVGCLGRCLISTGGTGNARLTFSFDQLINGFGADWNDVGTGNPLAGTLYGMRYTLFDGNTQVGNAVLQDWGGQQGSGSAFFGIFSSQSFNRLVVDVAPGDYVEVENLTVGRASVAEPSTLALTAAGLGGLLGVARCRRRHRRDA